MKTLNYTISLGLLLLAFSCGSGSYDDGFEYPEEGGAGDYLYTSNSTYTIANKQENKEVTSTGYIDVDLYDSQYDFRVLPDLGWTYYIYAEDIKEVTLSDGDIVFVFRINLTSQYVNNEEFRIIGTGNVELKDNDGSILDYVDGYIKGSSLIYEFESTRVNSAEKTTTYTEARRRR